MLLAVALHGVASICAKTCWRLITAKTVQQALLGWTVPILTGRCGKMTYRHSLQPFFGPAKQKKNSCPPHEMLKKKEYNGIATKKNQKKIEGRRNLTFDALCTKEVLHKCQRRHARFPVGRVVYVIENPWKCQTIIGWFGVFFSHGFGSLW